MCVCVCVCVLFLLLLPNQTFIGLMKELGLDGSTLASMVQGAGAVAVPAAPEKADNDPGAGEGVYSPKTVT